MSTLTPQQFVTNWSNTQLTESASYMTHFDDLCEWVGHAKPAHADDKILARLLALNLERAAQS